jgi:TonB family protein
MLQRLVLASICGIICASSEVAAQPCPSNPNAPHVSAFSSKSWISRPSSGDLDKYYPEKARRAGVEGSVQLNCAMTKDGTLTDCKMIDTPSDFGFGEAVLNLIPLFKAQPLVCGPAGFVTVIRFKLAPSAPMTTSPPVR